MPAAAQPVWVQAEQVAILYGNGKVILLANTLNPALVAALLWQWTGTTAIFWMAAVWLLTLARGGLMYAYRKIRPAPAETRRWALLFALGSAASGLVWGAGCYLLFVPGETIAQLVIACVVAGMAAGSIVTLGVWLPAAVAFMTPMLMGQAIVLLLQGDRQYLIMAGMTVLMWAIFTVVTVIYNRSLRRSLTLRLENLSLGERLEQAHLVEIGNQAKTRFFATMSHQLRTPLNAILGFSQILQSEMFGPVGSDQYKDYVRSINDSAQQLLRMIDEVLLLSSIEAGKVQLEDQQMDLREAVKTAVEGLRETAEARGVRLVTDLSDACAVVRADQFAVRQILTNLLLSALNSVPDGGQVSIATSLDQGRRLILKVAHSGSAASPQETAGKAENPAEIEPLVAHKGEQAGFGLSVAKALIEMHGGSLDLDSDKAPHSVAAARFPADRIVAGRGQAKRTPSAPGDDDRKDAGSGNGVRFG